jgi:periplasmic protein TonB
MKRVFISIILFSVFNAYSQNSPSGTNKSDIKSNCADTNSILICGTGGIAEFPGGDGAFSKYLSENLKYPQDAKDSSIAGTVYARFTVNSDGTICDIIIVRGISGYPSFETEVLRVLTLMPKWKPATDIDGKPVKVTMTIPVKFSLT